MLTLTVVVTSTGMLTLTATVTFTGYRFRLHL